jgi:DNA repair protein RadC
MNQYVVKLNCCVNAKTLEEARAKALSEIRIREAAPSVLTPLSVYELLREFHNKEREYFISLLLDTQNNLLKREVISVGTLNSSLIHPRELFRPAIAANCASVIVAHNHPSKSLQPSQEDLSVTKRLVDAGKLLGIAVVDHIIFTSDGYLSLRERDLL